MATSIERFKADVDRVFPHYPGLFDWQKRQLCLITYKHMQGRLGSGERQMLEFFVTVWRRTPTVDFNFVECAGTLDFTNKEIITGWLNNPYWP